MRGWPPTTPQTHHKQNKKRWWGRRPSNRTKHPHHQETVGSALLSHNPPVAVPSAQKGLTSRFGKDTGCNPLAKTTNTTKISNTPKGETHQSVKQYIHLTTQPTNPRRIRQGRVGREPHSGRKHHQKQTTNQTRPAKTRIYC